jgi:hypothetical protein
MPERRERAMGIHPLAKIVDDLFARIVAVQCLELVPLFPLRRTDKVQHHLGEDRPFPVKAGAIESHITAGFQRLLDASLESSFCILRRAHLPPPVIFAYQIKDSA